MNYRNSLQVSFIYQFNPSNFNIIICILKHIFINTLKISICKKKVLSLYIACQK
jgi:hypothetical protein